MERIFKCHFPFVLGIFLILNIVRLFGQGVAINEAGLPPEPSAQLDIASSTKGLLIPRLSTLERDQILQPAKALLIFNTTTNRFEVNMGIREEPNWMAIVTLSPTQLQKEFWVNGGNEINEKPGIIGTKNLASLYFISNDKVFLSLDSASERIGIHTTNPRAILDINGTDAIVLPSGTSSQRPVAPVPGMIRFNKETGKLEGYTNEGWKNLQ